MNFPARWARSIVSGAIVFAAAYASAQPPAELFPGEALPVTPGTYGVSAIAQNLDPEGIAGGQNFLLVKLPGDGVIMLQKTGYEYRGDGNALWQGTAPGHAGSAAVFTLHEGKLVARIGLDGKVYIIRPGPGNLHTAELVDERAFPECDVSAQEQASGGGSSQQAGSGEEGALEYIDLLSVYTRGARDKAGGTSEVEAMIQAAVDNANTAFVASNMTARYRLAHVQQVSYTTAGTTGDDLRWVDSDPEVAALRDQYGADMVSVIVDTPSSCGTAWVQRNPGPGFASLAFQATDIDCAVGNLTFAHEHGHNLGMEHNPENSGVGGDPASASYPFSFAHYVDGSYRTVMSYSAPCNNGCSRVMHHSNPDVQFNGVATGIANQRDNAQTGDLVAPIARAFRAAVANPATSVNVRIAQSGDDVEESTRTGAAYADSTDLEFGYDIFVDSEQLLGLRFLNVEVPAGVTVTEAFLEFVVDETGSDTTSAQIRVLAADDVAPFTLADWELANRATDSAVNWEVPPWLNVGESHRSPDLSPLIQSVVDRGGWVAGNSLGFVISSTGHRTAEAWDGDPASAPLLHVSWSEPGESPPIGPLPAVPPATPENLSAQVQQTGKGKNKTVTGVQLSWEHSSADATHFVLERCLETVSGKGKNRVTACEFGPYVGDIDGAARSVEVDTASDYRYRLKAVNGAGESGWSNSVKI